MPVSWAAFFRDWLPEKYPLGNATLGLIPENKVKMKLLLMQRKPRHSFYPCQCEPWFISLRQGVTLTTQMKITLISRFPPSAGLTGMPHHAWFSISHLDPTSKQRQCQTSLETTTPGLFSIHVGSLPLTPIITHPTPDSTSAAKMLLSFG